MVTELLLQCPVEYAPEVWPLGGIYYPADSPKELLH